jgi:hypothetical protein
MVVRHNGNEIYMASDGVVSSDTDDHLNEKHIKCFPTSVTSCVGLAGFSGLDFAATTRQSAIRLDLLLELERMSSEQVALHKPFLESVTNITTCFLSSYNSIMQLKDDRVKNARTGAGPTILEFMGYDTHTATYIHVSARFWATNSTEASLHIDSISPSYFYLIGVQDFLMATLSGKYANLKSLMPKELRQRLGDLAASDKQMDSPTVNATVLQLFAFHRKYAKQYGYPDGNVGPPYVIYRISTTNVTRIYYGGGRMDSDESVVCTIVATIVLIFIVGLLIFVLKK